MSVVIYKLILLLLLILILIYYYFFISFFLLLFYPIVPLFFIIWCYLIILAVFFLIIQLVQLLFYLCFYFYYLFLILFQEGKGILKHYAYSHRNALAEVYPDIGLDKNKFMQWDKISTRRAFFDKIAKEKGFNPLVAENWFKITPEEIVSFQVYPLFSILNSQFSILNSQFSILNSQFSILNSLFSLLPGGTKGFVLP
jgi:hypothetical protein